MRASPLNFGLKDCLTAGLSKQPSVSCSRTDAWAIVKGLTLSGQGSEHDKNAKKLSTAQPMLQNQGKQLDGKGITLLPYAAAHVRGWHALLSEDDALKRSLVSLFVTDHSFAQLKQVPKYHGWMVSLSVPVRLTGAACRRLSRAHR